MGEQDKLPITKTKPLILSAPNSVPKEEFEQWTKHIISELECVKTTCSRIKKTVSNIMNPESHTDNGTTLLHENGENGSIPKL